MPENPFIPPTPFPSAADRLRYAGQSAGSPMVETGPVITQPPHVVIEQKPFVRTAVEPVILPFQITVDGTSLVAAPGLVVTDAYAEVIQTSPTSGTWLFVVGVTIDNTTGAVTATSAEWETTMPTDTATTFYKLIADIGVISGTPDIGTLNQYDYGPIQVVAYGTPTAKWGVTLF